MVSVETISNKIQKLPPASQQEVLDLIDRLLEKRAELTPTEKVAAWREFVSSHANNPAVVDDTREAIYED